MACAEFDRTIDDDALAAYLRYLYVPAPRTIFRYAHKLLPGHVLTVDENAVIRDSRPYWSLDDTYRLGKNDAFEGSDEEGIDTLEELLSESVRLRMRADVPMGALLSGGIDSSVVVALMQAQATQPTRTFSIGFPGSAHDEAEHAAAIARRLGTNHTELAVTGQDALDVIPLLPDMFDEPLADPSQIPTYLVSKMARRDVTVALSGDGGDELFTGYERYLRGERVIARLMGVSRTVRRVAGAGVDAVGSGLWDRGYRTIAPFFSPVSRQRLAGEKARKLGILLRQDSETAMYRSLLSAWQSPEAALARASDPRSRVEALLDSHSRLPLLDRMMLVDQQTYLADDLLAKVDRASMAVSLEARVPLLDHRVVEFAWRLPRRFKVRDGRGKWILRQVLYRHVEPSLVDRPKVGFSVPVGPWLRNELRQWGEELLFASSNRAGDWLNTKEVRRVWDRFQSGGDESALALWAVLMFQAWRGRWAA
jgi:asparagine synthase (glutamine-hydrolysing)